MRHRAPRNPLASLRRRWRRPQRRASAAGLVGPNTRLAGAVASVLAVVVAGVLVGIGHLGGEDVPTAAERTYADRSRADEPSRSLGRTPLPTTDPPETTSVSSAPEPEPAAAPAARTVPDTPAEEPTPTARPEQPETTTEAPSPLEVPSTQVAAGGLSTADAPSPTAPTESGSLTPADGSSDSSSPTSEKPSPTSDSSSPTGSGDDDPPQTTIVSGPSPTEDARFVFDADEPASFACSLDGRAFRPCDSPQEYDGVDAGPHDFAVRAIDEAGNVDPTPDTYRWVSTGLDR